ncbi:hypothetical protein K443DRAFT_190362 [Laccaria amethystina LaAM-08-1]|uniref:Uncharacterized protein n=1 Tax=Laccaria amethystina LaAM-08-1 TaxID=1095629 RepID=A0A0C9XSU7_9AGAR|nr:hypothetical protein K443DRAFT_190362 [Laccaria amethystina LaAM-08-1]
MSESKLQVDCLQDGVGNRPWEEIAMRGCGAEILPDSPSSVNMLYTCPMYIYSRGATATGK